MLVYWKFAKPNSSVCLWDTYGLQSTNAVHKPHLSSHKSLYHQQSAPCYSLWRTGTNEESLGGPARRTRSRPQRGMAVEEATDYQTKCLLILTNLQRALTWVCLPVTWRSRRRIALGWCTTIVLSSHIPTTSRGLLTPVRAATLRLHCQQLHQPLSCLYYGGVNWFVWDIWHQPVICAEIKSYVCRQRSCMSAFTTIFIIYTM